MRKFVFLMCLATVSLTAGVANAGLWNPAQNGIFPPDVGNWSDWANWSGGVPGPDDAAIFNVTNAAECQVTSAQDTGKMLMGDGGDPVQNNVLRIMDGGNLTIGDSSTWTAIGYNRDCGKVIVERGGQINMDTHLYLGMNEGGIGRLVIDGGTVLVADTFRYGRRENSEGYMDLNSGVFQARYLNSEGPYGGHVDIKFGEFILTGGEDSDRDRIQALIETQFMLGFGIVGNVTLAQKSNDDWFVTGAIDPLHRIPTMDAYIMANPELDLSWVNLPSDPPGGDVEVDVWFGSDPTWDPDGNYIDFTKIVDHGVNTTSAIVDASISMQEYVWRVDTYGTNAAAAAEGIMMYFTVVDDLPIKSVVVDAPSMVTWVNEPVTLEATIVDDDVSDVTVTWSTDEADPNETWTDQVTVIPARSTYPVTVSATVAIDYPAGEVVVTATAADSSSLGGTVTDSVSIYVFENRCLATQELAGMPPADVPYDHPGDINQDCVINLEDLAILTSYWTVDYSLSGPTAIIP